MAAEQWHVQGENGVIQVMDLPLPPHFAGRIAKGDLTRVAEDGSPWMPEAAVPAPVGDRVAEAAGAGAADMPPLPAASASRPVWAEFATSQGMDPETVAGMTKAQIADEFTRRREAP